jgi:ribose/xylose/arabinose/galactoside ABC-type transport system permease subunit
VTRPIPDAVSVPAPARAAVPPRAIAAPGGNRRRKALTALRVAALIALAAAALSTPGFTSTPAVLAFLTTLSFVGCIAVGMTFITLSGNIMAFCLGATAAICAMTFMAGLVWGLVAALALALALGVAVMALQGAVIGYFRANPIIVSIAALALITGLSNLASGGRQVYAAGSGAEVLTGKAWGVPIEVLFFVAIVVIGHVLLSHTRFGRHVYMVGSNLRAAEAAGIRAWRTITGVYALAGLFAATSGILLAARYSAGDMELGLGYDYDSVAGVLVGGSAIQGGEGSVLRTLVGMVVIATVQVILILWGISKEWQYLLTGLIVLGAVMLHTLGDER